MLFVAVANLTFSPYLSSRRTSASCAALSPQRAPERPAGHNTYSKMSSARPYESTMTADLRRRPQPSEEELPGPKVAAGLGTNNDEADDIEHPSGKEKNSRAAQNIRRISLIVYFLSCCVAINITQFIGAPLYWINRDLYYAYMALTKESFGLLITTMTKIWGPTKIRISGDESVAGQIHLTADGRVEFDFPDRMVMIANHQVRLRAARPAPELEIVESVLTSCD